MPRFTRLLLLVLLVGASAVPVAHAQAPRQVRVTLGGTVTLQSLLEAGLDIVESRPGRSVDILEWPGDEVALAQLGASTSLVDANPGGTAALRASREMALRPRTVPARVWSAARQDGAYRTEFLPAAGEGSLGGYWTLAEIKMKLDDLVATDTRNLVANRLDTLGYSLHHRPIWGIKLGKTVVGPDTRPVAFYNSLTHAREPGGMQALFAFADTLLARYDNDAEAKCLLDQRQIYLVPCVNPDGYWYNQRIYDSTGTFGYWRKNLRDNNANGVTGAGDGVDLNRNYGFKWGFNSVGSSGSAGSEDRKSVV